MAPGFFDDDDDDSFFPDWIFYGYPKRKEPAWKRDEKLTNKEKKDDIPGIVWSGIFDEISVS